jgi:hypothetical protein
MRLRESVPDLPGERSEVLERHMLHAFVPDDAGPMCARCELSGWWHPDEKATEVQAAPLRDVHLTFSLYTPGGFISPQKYEELQALWRARHTAGTERKEKEPS